MEDMRTSLAAAVAADNAQPVLRWLTSWSRTSSPSSSREGLSGPSSPAPGIAALTEALHSELTVRPPALVRPTIRLPPQAYLRRPPPSFNLLTRTSLPSASFYNSSFTAVAPSFVTTHAVPTHAFSTRSSLDALRTFSAGSSHQHTHSFSTSPTSPAWWSFSKPSRPPLSRKKYRSPKNPIVFCHGLLGFDSVSIGPSIAPLQVTHWRGIAEALRANGAEVLITRVPATSSPADRAKVLKERISEVYPGRSVHLIGHSMGGLDCRYLTTHLTDRDFSVLSITTIATPHRGSSFADHFLSTLGRERLPSILFLLDLLPNGGGDGTAFEALTIDSMRKFNDATPDVAGVRYFSWGAVYEPSLFDTWKYPHSVIYEKEGPNDGLVSVRSAKWGTYLGTLQMVNHLDLVGWISTARYKWAEITGKEIKFRPTTFYLSIADMLANEVEDEESTPRHYSEEDIRQAISEAIGEGDDDNDSTSANSDEENSNGSRVVRPSLKN